MKTIIKTFKVKDLMPLVVIPRHQRWKEEPHIKNLKNDIVKNGFMSAMTLFELDNGLYSLENGYQRLSSVSEMPEQEVHCVIILKESKVKQDEVFLSLNKLNKNLTPFDFIRYHATKPSVNITNQEDTYVWLWEKIYKSANNLKEKEAALYNDVMFSDASVKDFFTDKDRFNDGLSKLNKRHNVRLSIYHNINQNWEKDYNRKSEITWEKSVHKLRKTAMIAQLNKFMKLNKNDNEIYQIIVDFAIYVNSNLDAHLTPNKDNLNKLYNKFVEKI
jgi:hypothetical protein